jgi:hypothetical protein
MKATHTLTAQFIILLGSAVPIVSAEPAQTAEWKTKRAAFQQAADAVKKKEAQP